MMANRKVDFNLMLIPPQTPTIEKIRESLSPDPKEKSAVSLNGTADAVGDIEEEKIVADLVHFDKKLIKPLESRRDLP